MPHSIAVLRQYRYYVFLYEIYLYSAVNRGSARQSLAVPLFKNNTFLSTILNLRIIGIKRFFLGVHACVIGADAFTNFT
jgi:hypothetical protein